MTNHTKFIADIGSNHEGSLSRALDLISLAAESGADIVKFQNFRASSIVSDAAFRALSTNLSHQASWSKSVFEVYKDAETPIHWTEALHQHCQSLGIEYSTSPYDLSDISTLDPFVTRWKIGSGDITWHELLSHVLATRKPVLLATGASSFDEVHQAVTIFDRYSTPIVLMQCNTNYTGSETIYDYTNLRVLSTYKTCYPHVTLGFSDHSPGHVAVLGAVTLGATYIEKHFTDDKTRIGPDHAFALDPEEWKNMVEDTRRLERCLGSSFKKIEPNEQYSYIVQRRSLCASRDLAEGTVLTTSDVTPLRPHPPSSFHPYQIQDILGQKINCEIKKGLPILTQMIQ